MCSPRSCSPSFRLQILVHICSISYFTTCVHGTVQIFSQEWKEGQDHSANSRTSAVWNSCWSDKSIDGYLQQDGGSLHRSLRLLLHVYLLSWTAWLLGLGSAVMLAELGRRSSQNPFLSCVAVSSEEAAWLTPLRILLLFRVCKTTLSGMKRQIPWCKRLGPALVLMWRIGSQCH